MKIKTEEQMLGCWVAVDDDTYDGPGSLIGSSEYSEHLAVMDLRARFEMLGNIKGMCACEQWLSEYWKRIGEEHERT